MDISERAVEDAIEHALLFGGPDARPEWVSDEFADSDFTPGGYRRREPQHYDRGLCLDPEMTLAFIYATQPKEWKRFQEQYGTDAKARFVGRLSQQVEMHGTLAVLRKGLKANGCKFRLAYFRPVSALNPDLQLLYQANVFSVIRQLEYSQESGKSLDLVLFLNGLPVFTAELKNHFTGQTVEHAVRQYRNDRDPREPLFSFGRCFAHFAIDPDQVQMATRLQGPTTRFGPFNQGRDGGAGNPPNWRGFATAYLWEQVWAKGSVLDIVQHFAHVIEEENEKGQRTGERRVVFPRYHQLDAVRRLVADAREHGPGQCYLIQHSAGSGKSNSIAWLAHQLSVLHDEDDRAIFDSVIVITDRVVLDRQLQRTIYQFQQVLGVVENVDQSSRQLKQALEDGRKIIVTTLQKFPVIAGEMQELPGQRFSVIVDEAHSSQTGESSRSLKQVLMAGDLEAAEAEESAAPEDDTEDRIAAQMRSRGRQPNVSFFAFTATPKPKTLELFGTKQSDGEYRPFSLYTMRQAIEEGYILDVLANYTTYREYWNLLKKVADDPRYDRRKASALLRAFVSLHEHTVAKKVEVMVEHFAAHVMPKIGGRAKAMIVTRSRLHAVKYKQAVDSYLKRKRYPFRSLVAFSGTVKDGVLDYTESQMNGFPDSQTADRFGQDDDNRLLIVAYKFQTGFDQPLLHTMYVDQKLGGVQAVQTLSRLNRIHPDKHETMVLDFGNEAEEIRLAFEPYYGATYLREGTDPNLLYDLQSRLEEFHVYDETEVSRFAGLYFREGATQDKLHALLAPAVQRYEALGEEEQTGFRGLLTDYVRTYAFLSQLIAFVDTDLEKLYVFARLLLRKLPLRRGQLPLEVQQNIDLESYRVHQTSKGKITLDRGAGELQPGVPAGEHTQQPEEVEPLSEIVKELNQRFGAELGEGDRVLIAQLEARLARDERLASSVRVNAPDQARLTFDLVVDDLLQDLVDTNFRFYKQYTDLPGFAEGLLAALFRRYREGLEGAQGPVSGPAP